MAYVPKVASSPEHCAVIIYISLNYSDLQKKEGINPVNPTSAKTSIEVEELIVLMCHLLCHHSYYQRVFLLISQESKSQDISLNDSGGIIWAGDAYH